MFKECPICGGSLKDVPVYIEFQSTDKYLMRMNDDYVKELLHKSTDTQMSNVKIMCPDCQTNLTKYLTDEALNELGTLLTNFILKKEDV